MPLRFITQIKATRVKSLSAFQHSGMYALPVLSAQASWTDIKFTSGTANLKEIPNKEDPGIQYKSILQFNGVDDEDNINKLSQLEPFDLIFIISYNTGKSKVLGMPNFPAKMIGELSTDNSSLISYKISCSSINRTPYLKI